MFACLLYLWCSCLPPSIFFVGACSSKHYEKLRSRLVCDTKIVLENKELCRKQKLILFFTIFENTFGSSLKFWKFWKFEIWNLKFEIWNLKFEFKICVWLCIWKYTSVSHMHNFWKTKFKNKENDCLLFLKMCNFKGFIEIMKRD